MRYPILTDRFVISVSENLICYYAAYADIDPHDGLDGLHYESWGPGGEDECWDEAYTHQQAVENAYKHRDEWYRRIFVASLKWDAEHGVIGADIRFKNYLDDVANDKASK